MPDGTFDEIEHTADWAIRVRSTTLPGLFSTAARGMFSLLCDLSTIDPTEWVEIELTTVDEETLLVDWLNELLFLSEERGIIFSEFSPTTGRAPGDEVTLIAMVHGGRPEQLSKTIKAATFNGLEIRRDPTGLSVEIVFDV